MSQTHTEVTKPGYRCASRSRSVALAVLVMVCSAQLLMIAGCHRGFYRRQADAEAKRLITQKAGSRWNTASGDIEINPMSRMFDPFSADHPPIPPDDPTAHKLMHEVDQKPGYPHWHANGNIDQVENPTWMSYLPVNENGEVVLSLSDAYRLALIHSPDLQQQRETLYLSALEVSIQRFGFDTQLFSGFNSFFNSSGRFQNGSGNSSTTFESSLGANGSGLQARRLGITGANFVVGLANTIMWEFSGTNNQSANSLINFSVIQPLLRGAGRERIMESLTQSERTLLANVRQLERFRRGFYLEIAMGRSAGAGPSQSSNAFLNLVALTGSNVGGYLGLLQQQQQIKNIEFSVAQFESLLVQFRELFDQDRIDALQVAQFESSVYSQQQILLNSRINYQDSLDRFKVLVGLPPDVDVQIEDPFLDEFKLIDDRFPERLQLIKQLRVETSEPIFALSNAIRELELKGEDGEDLSVGNQELVAQTQKLLPFLNRAKQLVSSILQEDLSAVQDDIKKLDDIRDDRLQYLASVKSDIESGKLESQIEPKVFTEESIPVAEKLTFQLESEENERSLASQLNRIQKEIDQNVAALNSYKASESNNETYKKIRDDFVKRIPDLLTEVDGIVLEMALLQASARSNVIEITDVRIDSDSAYETARCLRRDWMNARAAIVDRWRQIEFSADQLESQVDLVLTGAVGNANADNPFRIRYEDGNLRAGFRFDAPIVRQSERNAYRQAQISYQQARRRFYQFEDSISQGLRQTLRNVNQNKLLFELNRQSIDVNIKQVQLARARLVEPPRVGQASNLDNVTATFLTNAINGLTGTQNRYLGLWTQYEVLRRNLDFDMGTMELDSNFEWVDPGEIDSSIGARVAAREGVAENDRFCCGMQQSQMQVVDSFYEGEIIDSGFADPGYGSTVIEAPVEAVSPTDDQSVNELEFDSGPPVPSSGNVQEAPAVESVIELPPLSKSAPAPATLSTIGAVIAQSPRLNPNAAVPSTTTSSRAGFLDPFRLGAGREMDQRRLVANRRRLVANQGQLVKQKPPSDELDPLKPSEESSLNRAFLPRSEELLKVAEKDVQGGAKVRATILTR